MARDRSRGLAWSGEHWLLGAYRHQFSGRFGSWWCQDGRQRPDHVARQV